MINQNIRKSAITSKFDSEESRRRMMSKNMESNLAYQYELKDRDIDRIQILDSFRERYLDYRRRWKSNPANAISNRLTGDKFRESKLLPLSVDIEVASICDLACPFCYRQSVATPDKTMDPDLYYDLVDQCASMSVPSLKLNWRGEPLLHPKLPEFIDYAKSKGILEVIINTNATGLDRAKGKELIKAGLDLMIYSFDGASKETYDGMRPGRFKSNSFDVVFNNIREFSNTREAMNAIFPRTKIQMIITNKTFTEQDKFFDLFEDCVDDVSVKAYTERGGNIGDLSEGEIKNIKERLNISSLDVPFWRDYAGKLFVSNRRLPCEQPFQRLMVTYDGRVSMCCYDWGMSHPVGYVSDRGFSTGDRDYTDVLEAISSGKKGYAGVMERVQMPKRYAKPSNVVNSLEEIWYGNGIDKVREAHVTGRLESLAVCKGCPFKDTYEWTAIDE